MAAPVAQFRIGFLRQDTLLGLEEVGAEATWTDTV